MTEMANKLSSCQYELVLLWQTKTHPP